MKGKDIDNLENIILDLEDVESGAMISLSQEEINSLESILETLKSSISKDKIREKIEHYNDELEHIKNGEEFENEKPMYYWGKVALEELLEEKINE